jgi:CheY-like chemotaxis protein
MVLLVLMLLARRLTRLRPRKLDNRMAQTNSSVEENVAEQAAFTDFVAAFKVGPGTSSATTESEPASRPQVTTWDVSGEGAIAEGVGSLQIRQAAPAPTPSPAPVAPVLDESQKAARRLSFAAAAANELARLGQLLSEVTARPDTGGRRELLTETCSLIGAFKEMAPAEALPAWQVTAALEGLLKQLAGRPGLATASSLRTAAVGLELLKDLCLPGVRPGLTTNPPARFLAVDDDTVCRYAVATALKKAFTAPELAVDGATALGLADREKFDVIFLDIEMPGMDGFELCARIRGTAENEKTPVVFVTNHSDFDSRLKSTQSGAEDLIAKPFLSFKRERDPRRTSPFDSSGLFHRKEIMTN